MGRFLFIAALLSALTTFVAALALRAADATLAVAAVAGIAVLFTWYAQLHSSDEQSSAGLANPAAVVTLAVVGRRPWATTLPAVTAHVVGGVVGGLGALALDDRLGDTLVFGTPGLVVAGVGAAVVGVIGAWATLAIDAGGPEAFAAVPAVLSGSILSLALITAHQPAALIGLATAGVLPWDVALIAAGSTVAAAAVGGYAVSILVPSE